MNRFGDAAIALALFGEGFPSVLLTIRFKPIREEFLIVAFNSPHPLKLLCVLCVEVFDFDFLSFLRVSVPPW
jgi:hypothetical protein